jgi:RNA-directed DNA polymerase
LEDHWEVDHLVPLAQGGQDRYENLQLLHQHCHDQKTARDQTRAAGVRVTGLRH